MAAAAGNATNRMISDGAGTLERFVPVTEAATALMEQLWLICQFAFYFAGSPEIWL